jgi:hypothetical protein
VRVAPFKPLDTFDGTAFLSTRWNGHITVLVTLLLSPSGLGLNMAEKMGGKYETVIGHLA